MKKLEKNVIEFMNYFEQVFHDDWNYTKEMLGIVDEIEEQKKNAAEFGLETIEIISEKGTFLEPKIENETENWGNRAALLESYRKLKKEISDEFQSK